MPLLSAGKSRFLGGGRVPWYRAGGAPVPVAAYQPKGAASLAASYVNLTNPGTYNATWSGASPSWSADNGWMCSTANYLRIGVIPADGDWMIIRVSNVGTLVYACGATTSDANIFGILPTYSSNSHYLYGAAALNRVGTVATSGVFATTKAAGYRGGSVETAIAGALATLNYEMYLGARNASGTAGLSGTIYIQAFAYYRPAEQPTADQVAAVSAAMAAL